MHRLILILLAVFIAAFRAGAAPMTVKEIDFQLRMKTPDSDILRELAQRQLFAPLDAAAEKQLLASGASPALIAKLKSGEFTLSPEAAQTEAARQAMNRQRAAQSTADAAVAAAQIADRNQAIASRMQARGTVQSWLGDKLVYHEGGSLKPYDKSKIEGTRVFAFYVSASWCAPCKAFTPKFVAAYKELKSRHSELEVVFVSNDSNEFNMMQYMRSFSMPWPALKPKQMPQQLSPFVGGSIPWLVLVGDDGQPLTQNGVDRKYIEPGRIMETLDAFLTERQTKGL